MNKSLIAERFSKAITTYSQEASVQRQIADKMLHLLQEHLSIPCLNVIEFGCGTGIYSRMLLRTFRPKSLLLNDLCPNMKYCCEDLLKERQVTFLPGDAETINFPDSTSLITSCSSLQWFESPEKFFQRCNTLLNEHGYLAFSTFGKDNMKEVRELTGNGLSYRSLKELEVALSPHFDILHSEEEIISLSFENPIKVLYHLKQTGVNGLSTPPAIKREQNYKPKEHFWTRRDLSHFCEGYTKQFSQGGSVSLTYHPIYIIAKKKKV